MRCIGHCIRYVNEFIVCMFWRTSYHEAMEPGKLARTCIDTKKRDTRLEKGVQRLGCMKGK